MPRLPAACGRVRTLPQAAERRVQNIVDRLYIFRKRNLADACGGGATLPQGAKSGVEIYTKPFAPTQDRPRYFLHASRRPRQCAELELLYIFFALNLIFLHCRNNRGGLEAVFGDLLLGMASAKRKHHAKDRECSHLQNKRNEHGNHTHFIGFFAFAFVCYSKKVRGR